MPASRTAVTAWMWSQCPWVVSTRRTPVARHTSSSSSCSLAASSSTASPDVLRPHDEHVVLERTDDQLVDADVGVLEVRRTSHDSQSIGRLLNAFGGPGSRAIACRRARARSTARLGADAGLQPRVVHRRSDRECLRADVPSARAHRDRRRLVGWHTRGRRRARRARRRRSSTGSWSSARATKGSPDPEPRPRASREATSSRRSAPTTSTSPTRSSGC